MQPIEIYIYARKKHPSTVTDIRKKPMDFFNDTSRASTSAPEIIVQT